MTFLFLKIRCLRSIVAIIPMKQLIFKNKKSHVKKLKIFQHFVNISTDSKSSAIKSFKNGLIMHIYWPKNSKLNKTSNFLWFFVPKISFLKKSLLGSACNWLFWTHFWIPYAILVLKTYVWHLGSQRNVFSTLRT